MHRKLRILMAKPGLDGHDRGAKVIARTFRDAGMEVIYTGLHQSPEQIVTAALQEDVDVVALSILSGAHMSICRKVINGLAQSDAGDVVVIVGGTILDQDVPALQQMGVARVFVPGTPLEAGIDFLREKFGPERVD
ncbi:MAG: cobalamin B12-binding domain-containing protein [Proteobacteria bacterium]|nr:cobalamin B12-binding domain-containing protein [Pseudomonadota bacterium]MBU1452733.1 cobalamin B12-binding domain-containing protein [Pseudomonadota bacterium]MBU2467873.1 cobalamin B12-binding domain-containing protein [Pseudomonadota bacterium]MBU2519392.1 cobalamin B12-binding domain-containing protein [Pseudomonadota bacterium]